MTWHTLAHWRKLLLVNGGIAGLRRTAVSSNARPQSSGPMVRCSAGRQPPGQTRSEAGRIATAMNQAPLCEANHSIGNAVRKVQGMNVMRTHPEHEETPGKLSRNLQVLPERCTRVAVHLPVTICTGPQPQCNQGATATGLFRDFITSSSTWRDGRPYGPEQTPKAQGQKARSHLVASFGTALTPIRHPWLVSLSGLAEARVLQQAVDHQLRVRLASLNATNTFSIGKDFPNFRTYSLTYS